MSFADLLIEMDVLFALPALMLAAFLAWQAGATLLRFIRSAAPANPTYARRYGVSNLHRT